MNKTYLPAVLILVLMAGLHFYGSAHHLYHTIFWYDIMMHILGGIGIALSIHWFLMTFFKNSKSSFARIIMFTFVAGFFWETFETMNDIAGAPLGTHAYYVDTLKDLFDDTLGAVIAGLAIHLFRKK